MRGGFKPNFGDSEYVKPLATPKQRREFALMLRTVHKLMGGSPVFMGNESPEDMRKAEIIAKQKKRLAKQKLSTIIEGLRRMSDTYPELRKDFIDEMKEVGL